MESQQRFITMAILGAGMIAVGGVAAVASDSRSASPVVLSVSASGPGEHPAIERIAFGSSSPAVEGGPAQPGNPEPVDEEVVVIDRCGSVAGLPGLPGDLGGFGDLDDLLNQAMEDILGGVESAPAPTADPDDDRIEITIEGPDGTTTILLDEGESTAIEVEDGEVLIDPDDGAEVVTPDDVTTEAMPILEELTEMLDGFDLDGVFPGGVSGLPSGDCDDGEYVAE